MYTGVNFTHSYLSSLDHECSGWCLPTLYTCLICLRDHYTHFLTIFFKFIQRSLGQCIKVNFSFFFFSSIVNADEA